MPEPVLVIGATGRQGSAVARHLRANGLDVRAFVRDPVRAAPLESLGCSVHVGDLDDPATVAAAMSGCKVAFAMTTPYVAGPDQEVRHGRTIADAAKDAGIHLVYSSVGTNGTDTGVAQLDSKHAVEAHIRSLGIPHTVLAPAFFMEELRSPAFLPALKYGALSMALPDGIPLQLLALDDLGEFAAIVCESPEAFAGQRLVLAGDERDGTGMAAALAEGIGIDLAYGEIPLDAIEAYNPEFAALFAWYGTDGFAADLPMLRREYPIGWRTLKTWASEQDWSILLE